MSCRFQGVLGRDITVVVSPMCEVCGAGAGAKAQGERGGADCSQSEGWGGTERASPLASPAPRGRRQTERGTLSIHRRWRALVSHGTQGRHHGVLPSIDEAHRETV